MRSLIRRIWALSLLIAVAIAIPSPAVVAATPAPHLVTALKVTVLSTMLADNDEFGEWGYAALVEVDGRKFLFDTGAHPDIVLRNARTLGVDLAQVEDVVISHNHDDHTGGLLTLRRELMKINPRAMSRVHAGAGVFASRAGSNGREANGLLPLKADYEATGGRFILYEKPTELAPGVWLTGPVPRPNDETNWSPGLKLRTADGTAPDTIAEDSSLVFATANGMVILTGCGHAGIVNITEYASAITGSHQIIALIGGVHLFAKPDAVIRWTAAKLAPFHPHYLLMGHCTGIEATYELRALLGLARRTAVVSAVGSSFELGKGIEAGSIAA
ncbi:MBL fold metallo-hydrolase [Sphingomonas sp. MMS24-J13]|uniref:MBL fold metallo-hydrolase n=1 Tax=Sphingomonas sp. MMS24-J13 TaxID=3238686 RepID=UPI00384F57B4